MNFSQAEMSDKPYINKELREAKEQWRKKWFLTSL